MSAVVRENIIRSLRPIVDERRLNIWSPSNHHVILYPSILTGRVDISSLISERVFENLKNAAKFVKLVEWRHGGLYIFFDNEDEESLECFCDSVLKTLIV